MKGLLAIFNMIVAFLLGGVLLWGGIKKFEKPIPKPTAQLEAIRNGEFDVLPENTLIIKNYIFGLKQTNYFWQVLGISEILAGVLLVSQFLRFLGAVVALPITLHIFLFHLFLEHDDVGEFLQTTLMLFANGWLLGVRFSAWKHLLFSKSIF